MKAIVKVKKASAYSKFNGLTFPVAEILSTLICLEIEGRMVDFSYTEVILVDFQEYYQTEFDYFKANEAVGNDTTYNMYDKLFNYASKNKIKVQLH